MATYATRGQELSHTSLSLSQNNCVTAMAGRIHCLGCGGGLGNKRPYERRVLYSFTSKKVQESGVSRLSSKMPRTHDYTIDRLLTSLTVKYQR